MSKENPRKKDIIISLRISDEDNIYFDMVAEILREMSPFGADKVGRSDAVYALLETAAPIFNKAYADFFIKRFGKPVEEVLKSKIDALKSV